MKTLGLLVLCCGLAGVASASPSSCSPTSTTVCAADDQGNFGSLTLASGAFSNIVNESFVSSGLILEGSTLYTFTSGGDVYTVDPNGGSSSYPTAVTSLPITVNGATPGPDGSIYVVTTTDEIYTVNPQTWATSEVALNGGGGLGFGGDGLIFFYNNVLYVDSEETGPSSTDVLYSVNLSTGAVTQVGTDLGTGIYTGVVIGSTIYAGGAGGDIYTLDINSSAPTGALSAATSSTDSDAWFAFEQVAPDLDTTPEPSTGALAGMGLLLAMAIRSALARRSKA